MHRRSAPVVMFLALAFTPGMTLAQDEDAATASFSYATYLECDSTQEWLADTIAEEVFQPAYDAAVEAGAITGWGWLSHHTGGKWRRLRWHSSSSIDGVVEAVGSTMGKAAESDAAATAQFGRICGSHVDYIWRQVASSGGDGPRGKSSMSAYYVCKMADEQRADEIVTDVFAKVYDAQVEAGNLTSWAWLQHIVGGKYRRLATYSANDYGQLLAARGAINQELNENHGDAWEEFTKICGSHQDYLWNIVHERTAPPG